MKLNQFALYRVDQQKEGKVLWHLPYQKSTFMKRLDVHCADRTSE